MIFKKEGGLFVGRRARPRLMEENPEKKGRLAFLRCETLREEERNGERRQVDMTSDQTLFSKKFVTEGKKEKRDCSGMSIVLLKGEGGTAAFKTVADLLVVFEGKTDTAMGEKGEGRTLCLFVWFWEKKGKRLLGPGRSALPYS